MSTILQPPADRLVEIIDGLGIPNLTAKAWIPVPLPKFPCAVIELPDIGRTQPEAPESQLGARDFDLDYPVTFYFALRRAEEAQDRAADTIEAFINAVDADPTLGATCLDAKVTEAKPSYDEVTDQANPRLLFECVVRVWRLVL